MVKLLGDKSLRALLFVQTLNEQGIEPTIADSSAFVEAWTVNDFDPLTEGYFRATVDYLLAAKLLVKTTGTRRLTLSPAGQALLHAAETKDLAKGPSVPVEVVGRMNDPVVYAELLTRIDDVGSSLIIDPYLHPRDLSGLLQLSSTHRFLTLNKDVDGIKKNPRLQKFKIYMGTQPEKELRFASAQDGRELHDRLVIPLAGGDALSIGTSLGGKQVTVITRLGSGAAKALRDHYAPFWERGTRVEPIKREDDVTP